MQIKSAVTELIQISSGKHYLFMVHLTTLSVSETIQRRIGRTKWKNMEGSGRNLI